MSCQQFTTAPNNGMINCTGNIFEDTCTFSCNQGYELSGSEKRTCQSNKFWNGTKAMCTKGNDFYALSTENESTIGLFPTRLT